MSEKVRQCFSTIFTEGQRWHVRFQPRGFQPLRQHPFPTAMRRLDNNLFSDTSRSVCGGAGEEAADGLGVVTGRHQQVGEHEQLIVGEALPVLLPVIVVSTPELGQRLFHRHLWAKKTKQKNTIKSDSHAAGKVPVAVMDHLNYSLLRHIQSTATGDQFWRRRHWFRHQTAREVTSVLTYKTKTTLTEGYGLISVFPFNALLVCVCVFNWVPKALLTCHVYNYTKITTLIFAFTKKAISETKRERNPPPSDCGRLVLLDIFSACFSKSRAAVQRFDLWRKIQSPAIGVKRTV